VTLHVIAATRTDDAPEERAMSSLITLSDPRSSAAEAYQSLRTNLEFSSLGTALRSVLLVSAEGSGGKGIADASLAVANLGVAFAQAGDKVIIVDGDMRRPQQHEIFGVSNGRGLSTWLGEGEGPSAAALPALVQKTQVEGLSLLPAGPATANPIALLSTRRLSEALTALAAQASWVLIDAPPVLAVTDAALWASKVDGVVLLLSAGATRRDHAQRAKDVLEKVQAHLVGAVLLNADRDAAVAGYGG
jgi:non-specific protein-tyrosine kinase